MLVHEFVVMPDHVHFLITPSAEHSLEKCMQFIKGGFSFRANRELSFPGDVWSAGYNEVRVKSTAEFEAFRLYIHQNPVKRGLVRLAAEFEFSSATVLMDLPPK